MIRLGVLGSTKGTDLQAILDAISKKILKAKVSLVVSNNKNAYILKRAKNNNIPNYYISHESLSRKNFDSLVAEELKIYKVDLILLIGFMRILSKEFCLEWKDKILNVHPSLLPKYAGGMDNNVHEEVLKNINVSPEACYMVGNDVSEDMVAKNLGIETYLITDCLLNHRGEQVEADHVGTYVNFLDFEDKVSKGVFGEGSGLHENTNSFLEYNRGWD